MKAKFEFKFGHFENRLLRAQISDFTFKQLYEHSHSRMQDIFRTKATLTQHSQNTPNITLLKHKEYSHVHTLIHTHTHVYARNHTHTHT